MMVDILERVNKDFSESSNQAIEILSLFEDDMKLSPRITRCIIHLANGDISKLKYWIEEAKIDWRDIIGQAESFDFEFKKPFK